MQFYEELTKLGGHRVRSQGTCLAVFPETGLFWSGRERCYEAVGAVFDQPNSPVASTGVALDYLRESCRRVSEQRAREIHPALFDFLDNVSEIASPDLSDEKESETDW